MPTTVPFHGPLDAELLVIGEAPGRREVDQGQPFVGPSGHMMRSTLRWADIDPEAVRWGNVVLHNPGTFPSGKAGIALLEQYAAAVDEEIAQLKRLKVVLAVGNQALYRLTGKSGVGTWRGSVLWPSRDADGPLEWGSVTHPHALPIDVPVLPTIHPAAILRSKGRDDLLLLRRDTLKAVTACNRILQEYEHDTYVDKVSGHDLINMARAATEVYFDTEFDDEKGGIYLIGLTFDGKKCLTYWWNEEIAKAIAQIMAMPHLTKSAHNITADAKELAKKGINVTPPIYDTMIAFHALHPGQKVRLDMAARYYLEDVAQWKHMDHANPAYNALDVIYGWHVKKAQEREVATREPRFREELEARHRLLLTTYKMTYRGIQVDEASRRALVKSIGEKVVALNEEIIRVVSPIWHERARSATLRYNDCLNKIEQMRVTHTARCPKHPKYNALRKPSKCPFCKELYEEVSDFRAVYKKLLGAKLRCRTEANRWSEGFKPTNNEHLRWLLYDPMALRLPIQRTGDRSRRITANRDAIDKLLKHKLLKENQEARDILLKIKEVQHLEKARATFLEIPTDDAFVAHPPYKIHGTVTGRLAGGSDEDDKADNRYAFNILNIPREWRAMYVPPAGRVFVAADWRNVEGRLTAWFSGDHRYREVLAAELQGGPKVHSVNAGIIYGIDPGDAKKHQVMLSGQPRTAYDAGKRLTHAWSYGAGLRKLSQTFQIPFDEAVRIDFRLSEAYPQLVAWRRELVDRVLGVWSAEADTEPAGYKGQVCLKAGTRTLTNPFGWQHSFLGQGHAQANEVIAFLPQSTGAGMWTRCCPQLEEGWPVVTGTYDSFVLAVPVDEVKEAIDYITKVMEQPWEQLDGTTYPCEVEVGYNLGPWSESNERGLKEIA